MHCFKGTNELQLVWGNHFGEVMQARKNQLHVSSLSIQNVSTSNCKNDAALNSRKQHTEAGVAQHMTNSFL